MDGIDRTSSLTLLFGFFFLGGGGLSMLILDINLSPNEQNAYCSMEKKQRIG